MSVSGGGLNFVTLKSDNFPFFLHVGINLL